MSATVEPPSPQVPELVRVEVAQGVALVSVDNPPVNAMSDAVLEGLEASARRLGADEGVRAIVLTGAGGRAFMAGADLDELGRMLGDGDGIEQHTALTRRIFELWEELPQPVVAAVQAAAVGGGLELVLVCDLVVADPDARFGLPEVRIGLMPGAGGTQRLPRRIGTGPAKELLLLGTTITAARARELGLVNRVSAPGAALAEALALAGEHAALPALARRPAIKLAVDGHGDDRLAAGLERERSLFFEIVATEDVREGYRAFVEKRAPRFSHR
jgi:enoyl-CoA hydratase/carnithine racemase